MKVQCILCIWAKWLNYKWWQTMVELSVMIKPIIAEILVLSMACVILMVTTFSRHHKIATLYSLTQVALLSALVMTLCYFNTMPTIVFHGAVLSDLFARVLKIVVLFVSVAVFAYSRDFMSARAIPHGEYFALGLLSILGMLVMISANHLLVIYLGLELMSLPLYAMVALARDAKNGPEAAMKYFVMGALASGMLLYGMSLIYGASGSLNAVQIAHAVAFSAEQSQLMLGFGLVFLIVGIAFKLGSVPFHMWVPDVYDGAPLSVTLFISTAPKVAAFGMLGRLLLFTLPSMHFQWEMMWLVIGLLSITLGNLVAIAQTNIKRMFAYSAIAHMGYMVLGLYSGSFSGFSAAMFYIITYSLMSLGAFGLLTLLSHGGQEIENIQDLKGLSQRNSWLAAMMMIIVFSMAGIPPTVGFFAKLSVLMAVVNAGHVWVAVYALFFAVIGSYYYLRIIKVMYFDLPESSDLITIQWDTNVIFSINALLILFLGLFPAGLLQLCRQVFSL